MDFVSLISCFDYRFSFMFAQLSYSCQRYYRLFQNERIKYEIDLKLQKLTFPEFGSNFWRIVFQSHIYPDIMNAINNVNYWHFRGQYLSWISSIKTNHNYDFIDGKSVRNIYIEYNQIDIIDTRKYNIDELFDCISWLTDQKSIEEYFTEFIVLDFDDSEEFEFEEEF